MMTATMEQNYTETIVATLPIENVVSDVKLSELVGTIPLEVEQIQIFTDGDYQFACELGRKIKQYSDMVVKHYEPMKRAAHNAHATICKSEKSLLKPLQDAEKLLKNMLGAYALLKEQERLMLEEETRQRLLEQSNAKLEQALKAEENGDNSAYELAISEAEFADTMSQNISISTTIQKVNGVSQTKDWTIEVTDISKVPTDFCGVCIRPVDEKAVLKLARASKGTVEIQGIKITEIIKTSIRK